jgi:xanthosine utilization system XapX-like protein
MTPIDDLISQLRTGAIVLGLSMLGGFVSWIMKVRSGASPAWGITGLIGELCISAFAGLICFLMCRAGGLSETMTALLVAMAGHMGTRAIKAFEAFAERRWGAITGESK